ncbi:MAG: hypothetical protein KBB14_06225 [Thermoanaerobaculia bacterium]|nr:hypothetical protein [Thermoanaerobaculia bacterium]
MTVQPCKGQDGGRRVGVVPECECFRESECLELVHVLLWMASSHSEEIPAEAQLEDGLPSLEVRQRAPAPALPDAGGRAEGARNLLERIREEGRVSGSISEDVEDGGGVEGRAVTRGLAVGVEESWQDSDECRERGRAPEPEEWATPGVPPGGPVRIVHGLDVTLREEDVVEEREQGVSDEVVKGERPEVDLPTSFGCERDVELQTGFLLPVVLWRIEVVTVYGVLCGVRAGLLRHGQAPVFKLRKVRGGGTRGA